MSGGERGGGVCDTGKSEERISEKRAMNKHAMTPLEATLNRDLLLSIAAGESYEPTSIFD